MIAGRQGQGKSSAGNVILGPEADDEAAGFNAVSGVDVGSTTAEIRHRRLEDR